MSQDVSFIAAIFVVCVLVPILFTLFLDLIIQRKASSDPGSTL